MKKTIFCAALLFAAIITGCAAKDAAEPSTVQEILPTTIETTVIESEPSLQIPGFTAQEDWEPMTQQGLEILQVGSYTGAYLEDGSDEAVENVAAILVRNQGPALIEYGELTAGSGTFVFTGLPAGATMLVQEANRLTFSQLDGVRVTACIPATSVVTEFEKDFEVYLSDGVINVRNISGRSFSDDVFLYYKNYRYGVLLGGITYRARFSQLEDQAIGQSLQSHATAENTAVLYMTYGE